MERVISFVACFYRFISDPAFQDEQRWVKRLIPKLAVLHHNIWTSLRFIGGYLTIKADELFPGHPIIPLLVFIFFAITDWVDGKVARFRNVANGKWGAILDGTADKFFVIPVLWHYGSHLIFTFSLVVMSIIEYGGNVLLYFLNKSGKVRKVNGQIYEHLMIGKIKFFAQVVLAILLWAIKCFAFSWMWLPVYLNIVFGIITVLAAFSVLCKINSGNIKYFADSLTMGNILCGLAAIYIAKHSVIISAGLIIIAAVFDFFDGFASRKFGGSRFGPLADDLGDFISFALAPAWLMFNIGVPSTVVLFYALATTSRLVHFYFRKPVAGMFNGFPSTACATFIASLILWGSQKEIIFLIAIVLSIMEIIFPLKWYHFRKIAVFPPYIKTSIYLIFALTGIIGRTSETISIFIIIYFILFYRPVADRIWIKIYAQGV